MIAFYIIITAMISFMAGIVVGWRLYVSHLEFRKRVTEALVAEYTNWG